ncbi:putative BTB/POZ domain protein [Trichinella spiralis]|uniref:putative BTB/POZ domain protein n=1 Tax=Trichinella spiralis TaxID=6334 RepID=UPI0001EFC9B2|nr:putative BTB/POZ domain protein [Trichinella spiralis]
MGLEGTTMDVDSSRSVLGAGLAKQRKRGRFCDVHFSVRGRRVSAHRCVLAVRCAYFDTDVPAYNNKDDPIPVSCTTVGLFQQLLDYAYDGTVELNEGNVCEFLTLADMFGVHGLAEQCKTFLKLNLSIDNCAEIFKAVNSMNYQDLTTYVERFIASNADEVLRNSSNSLLALTIDQVLPFLNVVQAGASVETWMEFAFRWTSFDLSARENQFHALLAVKPTALNPNDILPTTDLLVSDALIAPGSIIIDDQSTDKSLFRCAKCNYSTYSNYRLKKHAISVHSVAKTFKCQLCDFKNIPLLFVCLFAIRLALSLSAFLHPTVDAKVDRCFAVKSALYAWRNSHCLIAGCRPHLRTDELCRPTCRRLLHADSDDDKWPSDRAGSRPFHPSADLAPERNQPLDLDHCIRSVHFQPYRRVRSEPTERMAREKKLFFS